MPKIGKISFNGTWSDTLGLFVTGSATYNAAEPDVTPYHVPGRNGDLLISNNSYLNVEVTYPAFLPYSLKTRVQNVRNWMRSTMSYARLLDTYDPDHYRMARPVGVLEVTGAHFNNGANLSLVFDCKPQRYLLTGTTTTIDYVGNVMDSLDVQNPTPFPAKPYIEIHGDIEAGDYIEIDGMSMTATQNYSTPFFVAIDCEDYNIYDIGTGANLNYLFTGDFIKITDVEPLVKWFFKNSGTLMIDFGWWEL